MNMLELPVGFVKLSQRVPEDMELVHRFSACIVLTYVNSFYKISIGDLY